MFPKIDKISQYQNIDKTDFVPDYELSLMLNSTSQSVNGAWAAYAANCLLRKYIVDISSLILKDRLIPVEVLHNYNLTITNRPFPLSK